MNRDLKKVIEEKIDSFKNLDISQQRKQIAALRSRLIRDIDQHKEAVTDRKQLLADAFLKRKELLLHRESIFSGWSGRTVLRVLSAPFIYGIIVPTIIFHVALEVYHQVSFRLYGISLVKRSDYMTFDRGQLAYLNWLEKLNCLYCSYFNGLMGYAMEIAGRTERYWCPIKYARRVRHHHDQYEHFVEYLDGQEYRKNIEKIRKF